MSGHRARPSAAPAGQSACRWRYVVLWTVVLAAAVEAAGNGRSGVSLFPPVSRRRSRRGPRPPPNRPELLLRPRETSGPAAPGVARRAAPRGRRCCHGDSLPAADGARAAWEGGLVPAPCSSAYNPLTGWAWVGGNIPGWCGEAPQICSPGSRMRGEGRRAAWQAGVLAQGHPGWRGSNENVLARGKAGLQDRLGEVIKHADLPGVPVGEKRVDQRG